MIDYCVILNKSRVMIGIIDVFSSVLWNKDYYSTGDFEIYTTATAEHIELLQMGFYVQLPNDDEVGIIEHIEKNFSVSKGEMIVASGRFAKGILDRRIIYRLNGTQNPAYVLTGNVEAAARALVNNNIIAAADANRNIPFIALGASAGIGKTIVDDGGNSAKKQTTGDNLLEYSDELLKEYEMAAHMVLGDGNKLLYTVFVGKDRSLNNTQGNDPVIFSREFDSLVESSYIKDDTMLKTTAIIGGAGEDLERFTVLYNGLWAGEERREFYVDAKNVQKKYRDDNDEEQEYDDYDYTMLLNAEAKTEMIELAVEETIGGVFDVTNSNYKYRRDFNIGDVVTVADSKIGLSKASRIVKIYESQDLNGYSLSVEFE